MRSVWNRGLPTIVIVLGAAFPLTLAVRMHLGVQGARVDSPRPTAADVAALGIGATEYLLTLGIAVLGVVAALLSQKLNILRPKLSHGERRSLLFGGIFCGLSLFTGFIAHQVILRAAADAVVRHSLEWIISLHAVQLLELGAGLLLVAGVVLKVLWKEGEDT